MWQICSRVRARTILLKLTDKNDMDEGAALFIINERKSRQQNNGDGSTLAIEEIFLFGVSTALFPFVLFWKDLVFAV